MRLSVIVPASRSRSPTITAYVAPETDRQVLVDFYLKTRPSGPGWEPIRTDPRVVRSNAFAVVRSTPDVDAGNPVIAQGGPRAMQWALKYIF